MSTVPQIKTPWRIAHRGYHARCVENTLEAFASAYGLGCDLVEFDVQLSRDGIPVIFHDDDLRRLAGRPEPVCELTAAELAKISLRDPITSAVGRIPTLATFLVSFGSHSFYLEMKVPDAKNQSPEYWKNLVRQSVQALKRAHPQSFVASFHLDAVRYALGECRTPRSALIHEKFGTLRDAVEAAHPDPLKHRLFDSVSYSVFKQAEKAGLALQPEKVLLWNVKSREQFEAARKSEIAGVVADDVPGMLEYFQNRA